MQLYDLESELVVIGTVYLFRKEVDAGIMSEIGSQLFSVQQHRALWELVKQSDGSEDYYLLLESAQKKGCLIELMRASDHAIPVEALPKYVRQLQKHAEGRRLARAGDAIARSAEAGEYRRAREELSEAAEKKPIGKLTSFESGEKWRDKMLQRLRDLEEGRGAGIKTGWRLFDLSLNGSLGGGIVPGHLGVIGGRPGSGKSSFMVQLLGSVIQTDPVAIFSFEMTGDALIEKLASPWCAIYSGAVEGRHINSKWMSAACERNAHLLQNVHVRDDSGLLIEEILEEADRLAALGVRVFAIDYLQRVNLGIDDPALTRFGIQRVTGELAKHAKERGVAWVVLSQISRGGDAGSGPSLATLKESGSIEEDAAWVVSVHGPSAEDNSQREIRILKNRYGGHDQETIAVDWRFQRFPLAPTPIADRDRKGGWIE